MWSGTLGDRSSELAVTAQLGARCAPSNAGTPLNGPAPGGHSQGAENAGAELVRLAPRYRVTPVAAGGAATSWTAGRWRERTPGPTHRQCRRRSGHRPGAVGAGPEGAAAVACWRR